MVTNPSLAVIRPSGVPARAKVKPAAAGLALINEVLDVDVVQAMVDADRFSTEIRGGPEGTVFLGDYVGSEWEKISTCERFLERALPLHRSWLPRFARAHLASQ